MRCLNKTAAVLLVDLSNVAARALSVAGEDGYMELFCRMLEKQHRQHPNYQLVFAIEGAGTLRRQQIVSQYKGGRVPTPEFQLARNTAIKLVGLLDCRVIKAPDGEADDAIGSFCRQHPDDEIVILSDDRDLWQLITTNVLVKSRVKGSVVLVDRFACHRLLGVEPMYIPMMKALLGDNSDCIPRAIDRVHKKKLLRLAVVKTVDELTETAEAADWLTPGDKKKITARLDVVKQQLRVTRVWADLPLKTKRCRLNETELRRFLQGYNLQRSLLW